MTVVPRSMGIPGTRSAWLHTGLSLERAPLRADAQTEVCIIGAGIAGMCCAHALARDGVRVVVLDDGLIGGGETARTTAHLSNVMDDRYYRIEQLRSEEAARVCAQSHSSAIDALERMVIDEGIACEFERVDGYLFLPPGEDPDLLTRELDAAMRAGMDGVELVDKAPGFESGRCLRFPRQGQFDPLNFLTGLCAAIERLGGVVHTRTHASGIDSREGLVVRTSQGPLVRARSVVVATNSPVNDRVAIHTKQTAYRTYAIAARVPHGGVPSALYWDTSQKAGEPDGPYHYVRIAPRAAPADAAGTAGADDLMIIGGEDHVTGRADDGDERWHRLEQWGRAYWPAMREVTHRWSGQVMEPLDRTAFIGPNPGGPDGVFVVTGDSGQGMTHAAVASILLPALIRGEEHPWSRTYDPGRIPVKAAGDFAREGARMAGHYAEWLGPGARESDIRPGEGRVVRHGVNLLAVRRGMDGALHMKSAVCPHLGCILHWNHAEQSWDCPCHGSRFDECGVVLNGPANKEMSETKSANQERQGVES